jgi:hypothetical protein
MENTQNIPAQPTQIGNYIPAQIVDSAQTINTQLGIIPAQPVVELNSSYYNLNEMKAYWDAVFADEVIKEDETVRIVYFAVDPNEQNLTAAQKKKIIKLEGTYKGQINSFDSLVSTIQQLQTNAFGKKLGVSLGAAIYKNNPDPDVAPSISSFDRTRTMVLDVDCYYNMNKNQKDRINFKEFDHKNIQFVAIQIFNYMSQLLSAKSTPLIVPSKVYCTGGGFQFHLQFEEALNAAEARKIFSMYKTMLASERFLVTGVMNSEIIGVSVLDFYADIDMTFADISHVQRLGGMMNQKYDMMPIDISDVFGTEIGQHYNIKAGADRSKFNIKTLASTELHDIIKNYFNGNAEDSLYSSIDSCSKTSDEKKFLFNKFDQALMNYSIFLKASYGVTLTKADYISLTGMIIKSDKVIAEATNVGDASLNDILFKINGNIAISILREELDFRQEIGNLIRVNCPFHDEANASFAIYKNENGKTILMDFHDNETYNIVTFWMKLKGIDKNSAINQLISKSGITFSGRESKSLQKVLEKSSVEDLIKEIDRENFIYYRLTSKQKHCIVRHIDSGECFVFDGTKMLADHVLDNQLQQKGLDLEFRAIFHIAFCEHILIDAFEEFNPGMPALYSRNFIQFVNTWIPGKNYKEVHKLAQTFEIMDIDSALNMIKDNTPWMYKYLLQITQKGNLKYFINWLASSSQFRVMPILPVMTSNFGTGKNVFVEYVLNFYFNAEYVSVMSSDRVQNQFNSQLETCSMLILDEGEFSKSKEVDNLKFLTGNNTLTIEKKGIDASKKKKWFNTIMLTNGESPISHPIGERRFTYFRLDVPLYVTCQYLGVSFEQFIENIQKELVSFWAILAKTKVNTNWAFQADKNNQYFKQILLMHPFGKLVIKMLNDQWQDLQLQISESVTDVLQQSNNIKMINEIQSQFKTTGKLSLALVNAYMKSLSYKHYQSVQQFIQGNQLQEHGFFINSDDNGVFITLDIAKIKESISMVNNLIEIIPEYFRDQEDKEIKIALNVQNIKAKKISTLITSDPKVPNQFPKDITQQELNLFNHEQEITPIQLNPQKPTLNLNSSGAPSLPGLPG